MKRLLQVLFWSIITAAFIGPGTVTVAAKSGAQFSYSLLWALLFSTVACLVLQEAAARITVVSGQNLGQAIAARYKDKRTGLPVMLLVLGAVILGNAAYQAGNILGGVSGAVLGTGLPRYLLTLVIGLAAFFLLFFGTTRTVARVLGVVVAIMGIAFLVTAFLLKPPLWALLKGTFLPSFPDGSGLLIIGLIGTTVVPYNLFLGSGLAAGQKLPELRFGLGIAIILGGLISMAVLVVGAAITVGFSFETLSSALASKLGNWARLFFAIGLFSAGFSSAITAPLAASITAQSLFGSKTDKEDPRWHPASWRYRGIWGGVLLVGIVFGLMDVRPIQAIILAQALNGVLLPFVAVFLFLAVNDRKLMGTEGLNGIFANILTGGIVMVTILLGVKNVVHALAKAVGWVIPGQGTIMLISLAVMIFSAIPIGLAVKRGRG